MGSRTIGYTGEWVTFTVPARVGYVTVTVDGAGSGTSPGGRVTGRIKVTGGQVLWIAVGQEGQGNNTVVGGAAAFGGGGAGGNGISNPGGKGGGGATAIRLGSKTGLIKAVAGGAGGASGNGGLGGAGGADTGEYGHPGVEGQGEYGNATGGTQTQGGNGGTSGLGSSYAGDDALDTALIPGGDGGSTSVSDTYGGGGGGGGYHAGGGGQAGLSGDTTAGGGAGGSNFTGGLISYSTTQGGGGTGVGAVSITWINPAPANQPPGVPTDVRLNNVAVSGDDHVTWSTGSLPVSAVVNDPDSGQAVRLVVQYSAVQNFSSGVITVSSVLHNQGTRAGVTLTGLSQNTHYWMRVYARDSAGLLSSNYRSVNFWTNRFPLAPELTAPVENATMSQLVSVVFTWNHLDPDRPADDTGSATQRAYELQWRTSGTPFVAPGVWTLVGMVTPTETYTANPGTFKANYFYDWQVRTSDPEGSWGPWANPNSFFITGLAIAPTPTSPLDGRATDMTRVIRFSWVFRDPDEGDSQHTADLRYRAVGTADSDWIETDGSVTEPGPNQYWDLPANTLYANVHYEWQVRTTDSLTGTVSDWSETGDFWTIRTPGEAVANVPLPDEKGAIAEGLGIGTHRVFVYRRGGSVLVGEITPLASVTWNRKRDDISNCVIDTNGFGEDCCQLLAELRCWMHELVVFRDGVRVWEGPITRITYDPDSVEVEAKDVMAYVYRRIMRQGYDDSYRVVNGVTMGSATVVQRAMLITMNALAPDDPNVLPYLSSIEFPDDANQSRVVPDWSRTAWEEVDDLAATAGLDYTTVGRRILYWDTHRPIGRLPEMRDENFSSPPVVTEYGMQTATVFGVTNNAGVWGVATRDNSAYGMIEQLASAYGETEDSGAVTEVLTAAQTLALQATLSAQAERNIADRYPTPLVVRVPDNSTIMPDTNVGINQLVPGVWVPLRARATCRMVTQWQKLDLVTVAQDEKGEQVTITMTQAPNGGADPDADQAVEDA